MGKIPAFIFFEIDFPFSVARSIPVTKYLYLFTFFVEAEIKPSQLVSFNDFTKKKLIY